MNNPVDYWYKKYLQEKEKNKKTIKTLQIKQEWSEKDEEMVQIIKHQLGGTITGITLPMLSWFNSIKERLDCKNEENCSMSLILIVIKL